jgi:hypothetical protein
MHPLFTYVRGKLFKWLLSLKNIILLYNMTIPIDIFIKVLIIWDPSETRVKVVCKRRRIPKSYVYLCKIKRQICFKYGLINFAKLDSWSSRPRLWLNGQGHHVHEARVVTTHEAFEARITISDVEPYCELYHSLTHQMTERLPDLFVSIICMKIIVLENYRIIKFSFRWALDLSNGHFMLLLEHIFLNFHFHFDALIA